MRAIVIKSRNRTVVEIDLVPTLTVFSRSSAA